ncbi:type II secretion system protein E [Clostridium homopropionicum DSM 5847]|uniref:Type II secretion system protein E n=1 Tax=Clostridium homopropionicum DSM 5847 TaxID=1121318 RepID=A0A0L6ZEL6_9CLOT|nr:GspE/PulE family protein [Clostridium homopropionicum]KOA21420.1 type II secretion system protein E [Clostridium homopropionicum DSM 5847]SFG10443.1 type IV pilus assembly protein PilB [Clostridium homopropionicum]
MSVLNKKRLGDLLVEAGKITEQQLKTELDRQRQTGIKLGELLVKDKILSEEDIIDVLEFQLGIKRVYLDMLKLDRKAVRAIPEGLAKKYSLIAIGYEGNKIKVAMSDPLNLFAIDDVSIATGREVILFIDTKSNIDKVIDRYYSTEYVEKAAEELSKSTYKEEVKEGLGDTDDVKNAPIVKLIDSIINNAVKAKASDIHIEPFENYIKIRFRVDGSLQEVLKAPKETLGSLIARIKILASLDIAEKRIPQDGRIITKIDNEPIDLRVSSLPTVFGEKIVIRILKRSNFLLGKEQLGMSKDDMEIMERIIKSPYGIILVTGPTGSGKSTTLYSMLNELNGIKSNIITVEDPVEYMMEGINQVNVNTKAGLTFATGLRAILRQDPDIIMIGEIRDNETAEIAVRAAITGHLVLSTIHTNDAASAIVRLEDMGIEQYLVAASLTGVIAQRLVKKICPKCKEAYDANEAEKNLLGEEPENPLKLYRGVGCNYCNNTGYYGRTGIYEIMEITREHRVIMQGSHDLDEIRKISIENGAKTLKMSCVDLVLRGETTIDELTTVAFLKD